MFSDEKIAAIISNNPGNMKACCHELINEANEAGGHDNVTVILAQVFEAGKAPKLENPPFLFQKLDKPSPCKSV